MENIDAGVGALPMREKKQEAEVKKVVEEEEEEEVEGEIEEEEEECIQMKNEMTFYLKEAPKYRISGVAEWGENSQGDIMRAVDTYFLHPLTGRRCESAWGCLVGWSEPDEYAEEKWETLCRRIEEYENIEQDMCCEKSIGV